MNKEGMGIHRGEQPGGSPDEGIEAVRGDNQGAREDHGAVRDSLSSVDRDQVGILGEMPSEAGAETHGELHEGVRFGIDAGLDAGVQVEADRTREVMADGPRIYVASLSDYQSGILHGEWLEANQDVADLAEQVRAMLARSPTARRWGDVAEEYAIHDFEGFESARISEFERLEVVSELAAGIMEHGPAFAAWWSEVRPLRGKGDGGDSGEGRYSFEECFEGAFSDMEDFGWSLLDDSGFDQSESLKAVPEHVRPYVQIDVAGWTRDLIASGQFEVVEHERGVWVFTIY